MLWDIFVDIPVRQRLAVPSSAGHASGRVRPASEASLFNLFLCSTLVREWYCQIQSAYRRWAAAAAAARELRSFFALLLFFLFIIRLHVVMGSPQVMSRVHVHLRL